jgi:cation diffusion facilitator family transporter
MDLSSIRLKKKAALISLIIGFMMFGGKMGAYLLTNSAAILSDALESVVHIIATSFAFYSLYLSLKPPDKKYPYGYGKIEYFSAGFEGALIIIAAFSIIFYAVKDIVRGSDITQVDIGAIIIFIASVVNVALGLYLIRSGKKTNSLILVADGKHVMTDAYTSIGAFIALILVLLTGIKLFDPVVAIILALNILYTGKNLVKESVLGLMNVTDNRMMEEIASTLDEEKKAHPNWIDLHLLRYWKSGEKFIVDFHITIPYFLSVVEAHNVSHELENIFSKIFSTEDVDILAHVEPCEPTCCIICRKENCAVRAEKHSKDIMWDVKNLTTESEYSLIK